MTRPPRLPGGGQPGWSSCSPSAPLASEWQHTAAVRAAKWKGHTCCIQSEASCHIHLHTCDWNCFIIHFYIQSTWIIFHVTSLSETHPTHTHTSIHQPTGMIDLILHRAQSDPPVPVKAMSWFNIDWSIVRLIACSGLSCTANVPWMMHL